MKWTNDSADNPGYSVYYAIPKRDPNVLYVIRRKKDLPEVGWRVFARPTKEQPLKVIYVAQKLPEAKKFVQEWEDAISAAAS